MDNLYDYFTYDDCKIIENGPTWIKKINEDKGKYLLQKNIGLYMQISETPNIVPTFVEFVSIPEEKINIDSLKKLKGKFIFLEWTEGAMRKIPNHSVLNCIKILDPDTDNLIYPKDWNCDIGVIGVTYDELRKTSALVREGMGTPFITEDKFKEEQFYSLNNIDWKFKWNIWIPIDCYEELFKD